MYLCQFESANVENKRKKKRSPEKRVANILCRLKTFDAPAKSQYPLTRVSSDMCTIRSAINPAHTLAQDCDSHRPDDRRVADKIWYYFCQVTIFLLWSCDRNEELKETASPEFQFLRRIRFWHCFSDLLCRGRNTRRKSIASNGSSLVFYFTSGAQN